MCRPAGASLIGGNVFTTKRLLLTELFKNGCNGIGDEHRHEDRHDVYAEIATLIATRCRDGSQSGGS